MQAEDSIGLAAWPRTPAQAVAVQRALSGRVVRHDVLGAVRRVAGVDVGFPMPAWARAAVAVLSFPGLDSLEHVLAGQSVTFPYIPGLLSFRELPVVLEALRRLVHPPDVLLVDGQGIAHPRRFGIACHLGILTGLPSIGVAKTRLVGKHQAVPDRRGAWAPLRDGDEVIGAVLRSRVGVRPIYVSVGHRVSLDTALSLVMACVTRFRLPQTTRAAHALASQTATAGVWQPPH
ncbi:deoxyribonuclease V [Immundisolibacter sp.]|uniref:deoxyribonuclease V n=1 Tax=Immundisolibacter sp. TaxID=1934948 RepID=UPI003567F015